MGTINDLGVELRFGIPAFRIALPPGWVRHVPTNAAQDDDVKRASAIFKRANRPDLDAEFRTLMAQTTQAMARTKVFEIYRQEQVEMDDLLPMSITASALSGTDGENLDGWVADAFRTKGAEFLDDARHIVRWSSEPARPSGARRIEGVGGRSLTYLIPVPGTQRRKALVFTTTIVIPDGEVLPAELVDAMELLSDAMISTFTWEQLAEEQAVPEADA
jgi:hypothetical protein